MLALVGTLLWIGFAAWRAAAGPQRERYAALLAAMLAFAVGAAFDWFWEIAGLGAVFFLAAGVLVGVRCAQLASGPRREQTEDERRYGLAVAGLGVAWIAAVALVGPLLVEREIKSSQQRRGRAATSPAPSTTPTPPARSSPGRPPPTCSSACSPSCRATTRRRPNG